MKKFVCVVLIIAMLCMFVGVSKAKTENLNMNGMVFLYFKFPDAAYKIFTTAKYPYVVELQHPKWTGLINVGKIVEVHIRIPLNESYVYVYCSTGEYPIRRINLEFYNIGKGYILFIFKGGVL